MRQWTTKEVQLLRKYYPSKLTSDIAMKINRTNTAVNHMANRLKLKKSAEYYEIVDSFRTRVKLWELHKPRNNVLEFGNLTKQMVK